MFSHRFFNSYTIVSILCCIISVIYTIHFSFLSSFVFNKDLFPITLFRVPHVQGIPKLSFPIPFNNVKLLFSFSAKGATSFLHKEYLIQKSLRKNIEPVSRDFTLNVIPIDSENNYVLLIDVAKNWSCPQAGKIHQSTFRFFIRVNTDIVALDILEIAS